MTKSACYSEGRAVLHRCGPLQSISNTLYAMAVLDRPDGQLIAGLTLAIERGQAGLDAQQTANCLWALAKLDAGMPETMLLLLQRLTTDHIGILNAQDVSNSAWALAKAQCLPRSALQVRLLPHRSSDTGAELYTLLADTQSEANDAP